MNFLPLILGFLLLKNFNIFGNKPNGTNFANNGKSNDTAQGTNGNTSDKPDGLGDIFDRVEDAQQALQLVSILNKIRRNQADLTEVLGEIMNNPIAMNLINRFGFGDSSKKQDNSTSDFEKDFYTQPNATPAKSQPSQSPSTPSDTPNPADFCASTPDEFAQSTADSFPRQSAFNPYQSPTQDSLNAQFNGNGKTFDSGFSPADTLFKPVEKIAGVELTGDLKKYYENWYVK